MRVWILLILTSLSTPLWAQVASPVIVAEGSRHTRIENFIYYREFFRISAKKVSPQEFAFTECRADEVAYARFVSNRRGVVRTFEDSDFEKLVWNPEHCRPLAEGRSFKLSELEEGLKSLGEETPSFFDFFNRYSFGPHATESAETARKFAREKSKDLLSRITADHQLTPLALNPDYEPMTEQMFPYLLWRLDPSKRAF